MHVINFNFSQLGTSLGFNKLNFQLFPTGFYIAPTLAKVSNSEVSISTFTGYIQDSVQSIGARIENTVLEAGITISSAAPYIVIRLTWVNSVANDWTYVNTDLVGIQATDLVVGMGVYAGPVLNSFDYTLQTHSPLENNGVNITYADRHSYGAGIPIVLQNGNNPPTVKQNTKLFYTNTSYAQYAIYETADQTFTWSTGYFPAQSDGTWYLYLKQATNSYGNYSVGTYGASKNAPTYDYLRQGYYNSDGLVLASFLSATGTVSDVTVYYQKNNKNVSSTYTVKQFDHYIAVTGTTTINLPTLANWKIWNNIQPYNNVIVIKNKGIGTVTVDADGVETIDSSLTFSLAPFEVMTLIADSSEWTVISF